MSKDPGTLVLPGPDGSPVSGYSAWSCVTGWFRGLRSLIGGLVFQVVLGMEEIGGSVSGLGALGTTVGRGGAPVHLGTRWQSPAHHWVQNASVGGHGSPLVVRVHRCGRWGSMSSMTKEEGTDTLASGPTPKSRKSYRRYCRPLRGAPIRWIQLIVDLMLFVFCYALAGRLTGRPDALASLLTPADGLLLLAAITWAVTLAVVSRLDGIFWDRDTHLGRLLLVSLGIMGAVGTISFCVSINMPRRLYVGFFTLGFLFLVSERLLDAGLLKWRRNRGHCPRVLLAGDAAQIDEVALRLGGGASPSVRIVGAVISTAGLKETATGLPVLGDLESTLDAAGQADADAVVFIGGSHADGVTVTPLIRDLAKRHVGVVVLPLLGTIAPRRIRMLRYGPIPGIMIDPAGALASAVKRLVDIMLSAALLIISMPIIVTTALAIKLEDGGPIIIRMPRVGLRGEEFDCLRFRSMAVDAEARLAALEDADILFKMAYDPRLTRVGMFIRRFSIDELPTLWNVLRGDMSIVGPRPALLREVEMYRPWEMCRFDMRPGLTGLWLVAGRSDVSWLAGHSLDAFYVDNWSLTGDLVILAKTFREVFSSGAY